MEPTKEMMKDGYVMYCRKSEESEDKQVESIPAQYEILRKLADERGLHVFAIYKESKSAKAPGRVEFDKMVKLIDSTGAKGILCWKLNRLFRNPEDEGKIRQRLSDGRIVEIIIPNKTYYEADSDFIMAVEGAQAQRFIRDLREDTKRGVDRKIEKGIFPGLAPVGYKNNVEMKQGEKTISPHPIYFEMMREIFNLALTGNYSVWKLCRVAKEMGIKNNRGKEISKSQLYKVLKNPFYYGEFKYAGKLYKNGIHKKLITKEESELINKHLDDRSRPRGVNHEWALTGILKCGICGRHIVAELHTKPSGLVFGYYKCTGKYRYNCPQTYIPLEKLENQAYDYLGKIKLSHSFVTWAIKTLKRATDDEKKAYKDKYRALRIEQDQVKEKLYKLQMNYATTDKIEEDIFERGMSELKDRRQKIHELLQDEDKDFDLITDVTVATLKFARDAQDKWKSGDPIYKKGIMRVIGTDLILNKEGKLEIKPRTPFLIIKKGLASKVQPRLKTANKRLNSVIDSKPGMSVYTSSIRGG